MTNIPLNKSISLIGPMAVGKSLIGEHLAQRLNVPYICIDDLIMFTQDEIQGELRPNSDNSGYILSYMQYLKDDDKISLRLTNPTYKDSVISQLQLYLQQYNKYHEILGDFKPFYPYVWRLKKDQILIHSDKQNIAYIQKLCTLFIKQVLKTINTPAVIDTPGYFGWKLKHSDISPAGHLRLKETSLHANISDTTKETEDILNNTHTVFLTPGLDYKYRKPDYPTKDNNILLNKLNRYSINADIEISTQGLFNNPNNEIFKQRAFCDPDELNIKRKLKNPGTISNICDEIILRIQDLQKSHEIEDFIDCK